jgi:hypothetical protein
MRFLKEVWWVVQGDYQERFEKGTPTVDNFPQQFEKLSWKVSLTFFPKR